MQRYNYLKIRSLKNSIIYTKVLIKILAASQCLQYSSKRTWVIIYDSIKYYISHYISLVGLEKCVSVILTV
jgi:hypothetical protein